MKAAQRDEDLISHIKDGDSESLDTLVGIYYNRTYRRVRQLVPIADAEDVTQDVFMNLTRSIYSFQGKSSFYTWFDHLILHKAADYHRKAFRRKSRFVLTPDVISDKRPPESDLEFDDLLKTLPGHYQKVIILRLRDDLDFHDIARELGIHLEAARSRYRRAIDFAAKRLSHDQKRVRADEPAVRKGMMG